MTSRRADHEVPISREATHWTLSAAFGCLAIIAALLIYQPYSARPLDTRDFSEFGPLLKGHDSLVTQFSKLTEYYATRGRANLIPYAAIVVKWNVFGWYMVGWQMLRYVQMCGLVALAFLVIRRFGASRVGAMLGASLFIVGGSAADAWVRLTMAEVIGTQLLLGGLLIAFDLQRAAKWWRHVAALALTCAALVLAKEMFVAAIPLLVVIAICWQPDDTVGVPRLSRRNVAVVAACSIGVIATVIPVALIALRAPAGAYTSTFGTEGVAWLRPVVWLTGAVTPYLVGAWRNPAWALAQLLVFTALLVVGWEALLKDTTRRQHYRGLLGLLVLHVLAGAVLYLPLPIYQPFYPMPFMIAPAAAVGLAGTGMQRLQPRSLVFNGLVSLGWAFVLCSAAMQAIDHRRATDAAQRFNAELVGAVAARRTTVDSLVVASKRPLRGARAWQSYGATIERYGRVISYDMPPAWDEDCATAQKHRSTGSARILVLRVVETCDPMSGPDTVIVRHFSQFDWDRLRPVDDSLVAELYRGLGRIEP
jgi:hypothetical protein